MIVRRLESGKALPPDPQAFRLIAELNRIALVDSAGGVACARSGGGPMQALEELVVFIPRQITMRVKKRRPSSDGG